MKKNTYLKVGVMFYCFLVFLFFSCGLPSAFVLQAPAVVSNLIQNQQVGFTGTGAEEILGYQLYYKIYNTDDFSEENSLIQNDINLFEQSEYVGAYLMDQNNFHPLILDENNDTTLISYRGSGNVVIDFSDTDNPVITVPDGSDPLTPYRSRITNSSEAHKGFIISEFEMDLSNITLTDFDLKNLQTRMAEYSGGDADPDSYTIAFVVLARGMDESLQQLFSLPVYLGSISI